jgi:hypothetical protein
VALSVVTGLLVNEICDISPWLALRMVRRAARLWSVGDHEVAEAYGEEWAAIIADCPGKLSKVVRAAGFLSGATLKASMHRVGRLKRRRRQIVSVIEFEPNGPGSDAIEATYVAWDEFIIGGVNPGDLVTLRFETAEDYVNFLGENPRYADTPMHLKWGDEVIPINRQGKAA